MPIKSQNCILGEVTQLSDSRLSETTKLSEVGGSGLSLSKTVYCISFTSILYIIVNHNVKAAPSTRLLIAKPVLL